MEPKDAYRAAANAAWSAIASLKGARPNPIGAGQDLESAAAILDEIEPPEWHAEEVSRIHERLRYEGSFAQDYKDLARRAPFTARVTSLAERLERLAGN